MFTAQAQYGPAGDQHFHSGRSGQQLCHEQAGF
jgi:hypothetical protein